MSPGWLARYPRRREGVGREANESRSLCQIAFELGQRFANRGIVAPKKARLHNDAGVGIVALDTVDQVDSVNFTANKGGCPYGSCQAAAGDGWR